MALCNAIAKNREEGFEGEYYRLDINPDAGYLLINSPFIGFTKLIINDSVKSFDQFQNKSIDFYFGDVLETTIMKKKIRSSDR
jgi:hypothetical protein